MLDLYLLRHGETAFSREDRFTGRLDLPLAAEGHDMAADFAVAYGHLPWRAIWASTRRRAIETAVPLAARTGLPIVCDGRLDEIDYGSWQGLTKAEIAARDPERFRRWREDPTVGAPGGEDVLAVARRVRSVIDEIVASALGEGRPDRRGSRQRGPILVVSHKTALRALVCGLLGLDLRDYRRAVAQPVGGVTRLSLARDARGLTVRVHGIGDTRHHGAARALELDVPAPARASWASVLPQTNGDLVGEQQAFVGGANGGLRDLQPAARNQTLGGVLAP